MKKEQRPLLPCEVDYLTTGRDWTADAPPASREQLVELVEMCADCPLKQACYDLGAAGMRDSEGRWQGHSIGLWGGYLWRQGRPIDPRGLQERGDYTSVYRSVHWDRTRGQWRAQIQADGKKVHVLYSDSEYECGIAAQEWRAERERALEEAERDLLDAA